QRLADRGLQLALGPYADKAVGDLAVAKHHQRRNAADAETFRGARIVVDVDFTNLDRGIFLRQFFDDRRDLSAGTTPRRPKIDEHSPISLQHFGVEVIVG